LHPLVGDHHPEWKLDRRRLLHSWPIADRPLITEPLTPGLTLAAAFGELERVI